MMKSTKGSENVFIDCGFTSAEAENLRVRSDMMIALRKHLRTHKLTQVKAASLLGVEPSTVSNLLKGKIEQFSIDQLVGMIASAGLHLDVRVEQAGPVKTAA